MYPIQDPWSKDINAKTNKVLPWASCSGQNPQWTTATSELFTEPTKRCQQPNHWLKRTLRLSVAHITPCANHTHMESEAYPFF